MNDQHCPLPTICPEALLRYSVLAQVEVLVLSGSPPSDAVREVAGRQHANPDGCLVQVSVRTLQRWRAAYASGDIEALVPKSRKRTETSLALSEALVAFLRVEKQCDPMASVPELLSRAKTSCIIAADLPIDRTTVWRACRRMGLPTRARPSKCEGDMRRGLYPNRMQCILVDENTSLQHIMKIMQCKLEYDYAESTTKENLNTDDFNALVTCIRDKPLCYRNKAVTVIAHFEGIPNGRIAKCLSITPRTVERQIHQFQTCGINEFLSNERKAPKKYELKE